MGGFDVNFLEYFHRLHSTLQAQKELTAMSISMYQVSVPVFQRVLKNLDAILVKAEAWATERKIDPAVLLVSRLAPDMLPFTRQVQLVSDFTKNSAARLAGVTPPKFEDTETTLEQLRARLAKTQEFLATLTASQIDGSEAKEIAFKLGPRDVSFKGQDFLLGFSLPNVYFHLTTAYAILRENGAPLGKADFMGG
jgi:hypothetical protein